MNTDAPEPPSDPTENASSPRAGLNLLLFFSVLLAPVLLTIVAVLFDKQGDLAPGIGFYGGGVAGIIGGVMLGRRVGRTLPAKIMLGVLFIVVLSAACIGMSCFGCLAGGYRLNFH